MAEIRPLRAWRYHPSLNDRISELTSPLFDVVSKKQREKLYQDPLNSIHLSVPLGVQPGNIALETLNRWKNEHVIEQDQKPAIYVYYQYFNLPDRKKEYIRKGFICFIKAYDWNENVVLRHENTIPGAVNDRIDLLEKTALNVSATHGLYSDDSHELEKYMDEAICRPVYETEDYQGVRDVLAIIDEPEIVNMFVEKLKDKQVILADGHHRYESSLVYRQKRMQANPSHTGQESYNYHLMFLTNAESEDLRILPTHRLVDGLPGFDEQEFISKMHQYFTVKEVENAPDLNEVILGKKWAFGIVLKNNAYKIRLKPEVFEQLHWNFPQEVKEVDLTVMHYFIIYKLLGIKGKDQRSTPYLRFERNFTECLAEVIKGEAQLAIITNEVTIEDVKKVCYSGFTMPQKSTYFYPKVICGFLFGSIDEKEF